MSEINLDLASVGWNENRGEVRALSGGAPNRGECSGIKADRAGSILRGACLSGDSAPAKIPS